MIAILFKLHGWSESAMFFDGSSLGMPRLRGTTDSSASPVYHRHLLDCYHPLYAHLL